MIDLQEKDRARMHFKIFHGHSRLFTTSLSTPATRKKRRRGARVRPRLEILEPRLTPSTYVWTALGDGQTWNDPTNWVRLGPSKPEQPPAVPTPYSDVVFPPIATLPGGSSTTINFNYLYLYMPLNSITIEGAYTFTGNPVTIDQSLSLSNPFTPQNGATTATIELAGVQLQPGVVVNTASGTTLQLGTTAAPTSLQLLLEGGLTKTGGGNLAIDTRNVSYSNATSVVPIPVAINGGSITLGTSVNLAGLSFQISSQAGLSVNDNVAARVQSIYGNGLIDLAGTTAAGDATSLSVAVPIGTSDQFDGLMSGVGSFIMAGTGTLTTNNIDFSGNGSILAASGTLDVVGSISAGSLQVSSIATFGGLGLWNFSGAVVFQAGSTFDVTLAGTTAGTQYTQLVDSNTTSGVNLSYPTLMASVAYEYEEQDLFTIIAAPVVTGAFGNVVAGQVVLGTGVPFAVGLSGTAVTLAPLQSATTTSLESSARTSTPGQIVTFTASVTTRTAPVNAGTVSFLLGSNVLATVALDSTGNASFSTAALPVGSNAIIAVYNGAGGIRGSQSAVVIQSVVPYNDIQTVTPLATTTSLFITTQSVGRGRVEYILVATVAPAEGNPLTTPAGFVLFRRNGRTFGKAKIVLGVAKIVLGRMRPSSKLTFAAVYQGGFQFQASTSLPFRT